VNLLVFKCSAYPSRSAFIYSSLELVWTRFLRQLALWGPKDEISMNLLENI
jgi:hypothetical protein